MPDLTPFEIAEHRWFNDAEFKARVTVVRRELQILGADQMDANNAIAVALVVDEQTRGDINHHAPDPSMVQAALDILRMAGWEIIESKGVGHLEAGLLVHAQGWSPRNKAFARRAAMEPWKEIP